VLELCIAGIEEDDAELYEPALELLAMQGAVFPHHLGGCLEGLIRLFTAAGQADDAATLQTAALKVRVCNLHC
jgi:hypothetical protein